MEKLSYNTNKFIQYLNKEEELAKERVYLIKEKYKILNDEKIANNLDLIFKVSSSDEELALNLQKFYYK